MDIRIDIDYIKKHQLILFEVVSGSQAYGLATPQSDVDIKGVFYLPKESFYTGDYLEQINNATNDVVYYELGKYIELLTKNNPNILEMMCTPDQHVLYKHPLIEQITPELFLSKLAKETFAGYAMTQIKKAKGLNKKFNNPVSETRLAVLDFCYIIQHGKTLPVKQWLMINHYENHYCGLAKLNHTKGVYALYYDRNAGYKGIVKDELSNDVACSSIEKGAELQVYLFFNQEAYSSHCKNYSEYWSWVEKRNESRYKGNQDHGKGYDAKNMMHTIRLLQQVNDLFKTGKLTVERKNREELLAIKRGERSYTELLHYAEELLLEIEEHSFVSSLQEFPDEQIVRQLLIGIREELYK